MDDTIRLLLGEARKRLLQLGASHPGVDNVSANYLSALDDRILKALATKGAGMDQFNGFQLEIINHYRKAVFAFAQNPCSKTRGELSRAGTRCITAGINPGAITHDDYAG